MTSNSYTSFVTACHEAWLAAGGDIEIARRESRRQVEYERNLPVERPTFDSRRLRCRSLSDPPARLQQPAVDDYWY